MNSIGGPVVGTTVSDWSNLDAKKFEEISKVCDEFKLPLTDSQILVNVDTQRLHLMSSQELVRSYLISTALNGVGQEEGTGQTPLGLHFIESKIGNGAQPLEIFQSRISIGAIAKPSGDDKCIVGRILWLQGVQPGFNQGKDSAGKVVDTHDRYIYIHGTPDFKNLGKPVSAGCIRMKPDDVIDLFERVFEKTPVYIYTEIT